MRQCSQLATSKAAAGNKAKKKKKITMWVDKHWKSAQSDASTLRDF